jgi:hypothetical protein
MSFFKMKLSKLTIITLLAAFCLVFQANISTAQSLLVGIPSATVAHKGHFEITHESQVNRWSQDKFKWNSFSFLCYGVSKKLELTTSLSNLNNQGYQNVTTGAGFKFVQPLVDSSSSLKAWEPKWVLGSNALYSLSRNTLGGWVYSMGSIRLPKVRTRLTGGVSYATSELYGHRYRFMQETQMLSVNPVRKATLLCGVEQPITKHFSVIADYFSGSHDLAALIMAVQYETENNVFILGYKLPNETQETDAIVIEVMHRF